MKRYTLAGAFIAGIFVCMFTINFLGCHNTITAEKNTTKPSSNNATFNAPSLPA